MVWLKRGDAHTDVSREVKFVRASIDSDRD